MEDACIRGIQKPDLRQSGTEFGKLLFSRLEAAAMRSGCELQGFWHLGVHHIPGSGLVPPNRAEAFLLRKKGLLSPIIVHTEQIVLQCGFFPFVSRYSLEADLNALFANTLIPESFL